MTKLITKKITLEKDVWDHIDKCAENGDVSIDTIIELSVYSMGVES